jgi:hypothetical protein
MYEYLTESDMTEYAAKFPDAVNWLMDRSLKRELEYLNRQAEQQQLNDWQKRRVAELLAFPHLKG